jgi:hypothetical protein
MSDISYAAPAPAPENHPKKKSFFKRKGWKILGILVLLAGFLIYWFFFNVYSDGERKGVLVKISKKGNVFKTYEGEMFVGCKMVINKSPDFIFSVTDKEVYEQLQKMQDECIVLKYKKYRASVLWRGDSEYIVTGFERIGNTPTGADR